MKRSERQRPGPRTDFGPKDFPSLSISLTKLSKRSLRAIAKREKRSVSAVVEYLVREHGAEVDFSRLLDGGSGAHDNIPSN